MMDPVKAIWYPLPHQPFAYTLSLAYRKDSEDSLGSGREGCKETHQRSFLENYPCSLPA
jgi:hypothetical protein